MKKKVKQAKNTKIKLDSLSSHYELLSYLMDHVPDVIYFKDRKGRLILVNQAHAKGLGLKPQQVVGKTDFDFFPKERAELMQKDDECVMKTGKPIIDKIERATRADGVDNYVSTTKIPRYDTKGNIVGIIGITRDITRRKQFEHLKEEKAHVEKKLEVSEELNRLKSEFISVVSHELRTPLAIIKQIVMLLLNETVGNLSTEQRTVIKKARNNAERLKSIIDALLDISRIESNKLKLYYSLVNLNELLKDTSDFFKNLAQEKGVELHYRLPKEQINLFIDAGRVNQILSNLIDNAIKFTEEGGKVTVEIRALESKVRIGVLDSGIGISKRDVSNLFNKFVQVSKDAGTERKGIGLGLSIAKELTERHGGEIWVESRLGVGSKFYFTLPRFYASSVMDADVKKKIDAFLQRGVSVQFFNLLLINYKEFIERSRIDPRGLFNDIKNIINETFTQASQLIKKNPPVVFMDIEHGSWSIISFETNEKESVAIARQLKNKIKKYFIQNKIENAFIALGVLLYPAGGQISKAPEDRSKTYQEIYIGSEMRRFKRVPFLSTIEILSPKDKSGVSNTVNISAGGICFLSETVLETDTRVKVKFLLPKTKKYITVTSRVAWIKKLKNAPGKVTERYSVGLEFINLNSQDRDFIDNELTL
ncbi:ATP-binding protein [Candidatus Omnitrophota bacterium]